MTDTQLPLNINPLTGLPLLKPSPQCMSCVEFYQFRIPSVGVEERCVTCNYHRAWVEKFEPKPRKKKPPCGESGS